MMEAASASGESPVDYMLRIMRDPTADPERRDAMAKAAATYLHPRPAPNHNPPRQEFDLSVYSDQELEILESLLERQEENGNPQERD